MFKKVLLGLLLLLFLINLQLNPYLVPPAAVSQPERATLIGDYGDAPEGVHAGYSGYFQEVLAGFPSVYDESEARYFIVHRLPRERVFLGDSAQGDTATDEVDARVVDWDLDDGVLPIYFLPCTQQVLEVEITVPEEAPAGPIYLNALFDWNHDGHWAGYDRCPPSNNFPEGKAPEWAIQNLRLDLPPYSIGPGFHGTIKTSPILPGESPGELWMRVTVTVDPVDEGRFVPVSRGGQGWDGRGDFLYGETEDYYTYIFGFCPQELPPWPAGPEVRPPDWNPTPPDLDPPPEEETPEEVCDGADNDGDGLIDEGLPDADGDGVCDGLDICSGGDDTIDTDGDFIPDDCDNCSLVVNIDQADPDRDGLGNPCDDCPYIYNPDQTDSDRDGIGDACETAPTEICDGLDNDGDGLVDEGFTDSDSDGTANCIDGCPNDTGKTAPGTCGCGVPDTDSDNDGAPDCHDQCPNDMNKTEPGACGCGTPDTDSDSDGTLDCHDQCPNDPHKTEPGVCGCGIADTDTDHDGTSDCNDQCPADANKTEPGVCGCGVTDTDSDSDGTPDCHDLCPTDANKADPGSCGCGIADTDSDSDGTPDCHDSCPADPNKINPGQCGCGAVDADADGDGTPDCHDNCPTDPAKTQPGVCGCGIADTDSDQDGTVDCHDNCPSDPDKTDPGVCGCGVADTDTDGDGTPDCHDSCLTDVNKVNPGACGCGIPDTDSDSDGIMDCHDGCPADPGKTQPGICGCGVADADSDGDGAYDCHDLCPTDPGKAAPDICGCGVADTDSDGDGVANCNDLCPADPGKVEPGLCGCSIPDTDSDDDGTPNCNDQCPSDPSKIVPGICGCGIADGDADNDGIPACNDCNDSNPSIYPSAPELCNGLDDNCNGQVDEGCQGCIALEKVGPTTARVGETITYSFRLTNCGDLVLHGGAQVYDPLLGGKIWDGVLQPGQTVTFTESYTIQPDDPDPLVNTATAIGHPMTPQGTYLPDVMDTASWTVDLTEGGGWDKSSLAFIGEGWSCDAGGKVFATVENRGEAMQGPTTWELLFAESGDPKNGVIVASGVIPPLPSGGTYTMSFNVTVSGNYMFKAHQRPGHPGKGELFSNAINFNKSNCP